MGFGPIMGMEPLHKCLKGRQEQKLESTNPAGRPKDLQEDPSHTSLKRQGHQDVCVVSSELSPGSKVAPHPGHPWLSRTHPAVWGDSNSLLPCNSSCSTPEGTSPPSPLVPSTQLWGALQELLRPLGTFKLTPARQLCCVVLFPVLRLVAYEPHPTPTSQTPRF